MAVAEEVLQLYDCFLVNIDIENCPMAEPLTDMFDTVTFTLFDNYQETLCPTTVVQMLEDTPWTNASTRATLLDAGFGTHISFN